MSLQIRFVALHLHQRITPRLCILHHHRLIKQLKALYILQGSCRRINVVKDDECLAAPLDALFGYNVDDVAVVAKDCA
jgi:hypothetical protein